MIKPSKERRQHKRIYHNFILMYREKGKSTAKLSVSQVNNVSLGGVNFLSTYPLKQESIVELDMKTPFIADSIRLEGIVLECKEKIPDMIYEIRLQFKDVSEEVSNVLKKIESYGNS